MRKYFVKEQIMVKIVEVSVSVATKLGLYQVVSAFVSGSVAINWPVSRIVLLYCIWNYAYAF